VVLRALLYVIIAFFGYAVVRQLFPV